jgi:hypothetical protein
MVQHVLVPLLFLSPFLSTESLKNAVNKPSFPMAMKAEVCIANPDATQKGGLYQVVAHLEALEPMPAYLIADDRSRVGTRAPSAPIWSWSWLSTMPT